MTTNTAPAIARATPKPPAEPAEAVPAAEAQPKRAKGRAVQLPSPGFRWRGARVNLDYIGQMVEFPQLWVLERNLRDRALHLSASRLELLRLRDGDHLSPLEAESFATCLTEVHVLIDTVKRRRSYLVRSAEQQIEGLFFDAAREVLPPADFAAVLTLAEQRRYSPAEVQA